MEATLNVGTIVQPQTQKGEAFGIMKQFLFKKFKKTKLHVTIVPNVFSACCLLHNVILERKEVDVKECMQVIELEVAMQGVNVASNGFNHNEENVRIQGKKL